jgi:GAF domain-containing protein
MPQVPLTSPVAPSTEALCVECTEIVESSGIETAVAWLNARTRFRFTGIYRVDPPHLRNVVLFDRENPNLNVSGEVTRLNDTYCAIVYGEGPFSTADSARDERLTGHPSRESVISYAGVPLRLENGHVWGTLCHFDVKPRLLKPEERAVLESVASVFLASLPTG